jgi:hypothetical protein
MDNRSGSECPKRRRLRYTSTLLYFVVFEIVFERERERKRDEFLNFFKAAKKKTKRK